MEAWKMPKMFMFITLNVLLAYLVAGLSTQARAQDQAMDIVKKMKEVFEPVRPSTRQVVISATSGGETVQWVARQARKQLPDGKRMAMVLLEPAELKGNAYVIWEPQEKPSVVWLYAPFVRRIRVGSSRVDLQACKLEYSIVSPK